MTHTEEDLVTGREAIARVKELVEDIDFTMLTTRNADGNLVGRPMSTRQMDDAGDPRRHDVARQGQLLTAVRRRVPGNPGTRRRGVGSEVQAR